MLLTPPNLKLANTTFLTTICILLLRARNKKSKSSINRTALPAYWLEPNSRAQISESTTNTYGDFMISNINYTFGPAATMSVSCSEAAERF